MSNRFSKFVVVLVIALNVGFVYYIGELMKTLGFEPTALIAAFFTFTTGELWALSKITRDKIKQPGDSENGR